MNTINYTPTNVVSVAYMVNDSVYPYQGTITYLSTDYVKKSDIDIKTDIQTLYDTWKTYVITPTKVLNKTEKQQKVLVLGKQKSDLQTEIDKLQAEIDASSIQIASN